MSFFSETSVFNGWLNRGAVQDVDSGGPKEPCVRWGPYPPRGRGNFLDGERCPHDAAFCQNSLTFCSVCYQSPFQQQALCLHYAVLYLPLVLWRCWLGGRKGIQLVKNWVVGCWRGYLSGARCRLAYDPADATCHSLSLASVKSRLVLPLWYRLTWVVPDKGPLNVCVCVCYAIHVCVRTKWCCWRVDEGWVRASLWAARCGSGHKTITTISGFSSGRQSCCRLCELWWRQCRERDGYQLTHI